MRGLLITTALVLSTSMAFAETKVVDTVGEQSNILGGEINNNFASDTGNTTVTHQAGSGTTTVNSSTPNGYVSNPNLTTGGSDVCLGSSQVGFQQQVSVSQVDPLQ